MAIIHLTDNDRITEETQVSIWATLSDEAKAAWSGMVAEEKALAAMIYNDIKAGVGAAEAHVIQAMPSIVTQLKAYALQCVTALEANPAFKNALGSWKFGVAAWQVMQAVETGMVPGVGGLVKSLAAATVETAVQAAFAAMVTGIIA